MIQSILSRTLIALLTSFTAMMVFAGTSNWGNYRGVERPTPHKHPPTHSHYPDHAYPRYWGDQHSHQRGYYQFRYTPSTEYEYRYEQRFFVGDQVPFQYRDSRYYVDDWAAHRLDEPPEDCRWMIIEGRYVLVSTPTFTITLVR